MAKKVKIKISKKTGEVFIEAEGFTGNSCAKATKDFLRALGTKESEKKKREWYETEEEKEVILKRN
jgi:hypothetical protein